MPISDLPTPPPSRAQTEAQFVSNSNALFGALPTLVTEFNAESALTNANRVAAETAAASAAAQVTLAAAQVTLAAAQVALAEDEAQRAELAANVAAGAANYRGDWLVGTAYLQGQSVSSGGKLFVAKRNNTGVTPVDGADWLELIGGPATQIASIATTSGSSITFANIPQTFTDLALEFVGVRQNQASNQLRIEVSGNGTNYTGAVTIGLYNAASNVLYGQVPIMGYRRGSISILAALVSLTANRTSLSTTPQTSVHRLDAPITHIRISLVGPAFDAGLIRLFGR